MKISISILILLILISAETFNGFAQTRETQKLAATKKYRVDPGGFIIVPEGFEAYQTKGFIDAWFGYIESQESDFKISFAAGTVESLFDKYKKQIVWTKIEDENNKQIKFGLLHEKKTETMLASTGWIQFLAKIKKESDKDLFMEIIRSYSNEKCDDCRSLPFKPQSNKVNKN